MTAGATDKSDNRMTKTIDFNNVEAYLCVQKINKYHLLPI